MSQLKIIIVIASSAALLAMGWFVNGWRLEVKYQKALLEAQEHARQVEQSWNKTLNKARDEQVKRESKLRIDADNARIAADRLRDTISNMPICTGDAGSNVSAYGVVLNESVSEYREMATIADRCESEKQTLMDAWPK